MLENVIDQYLRQLHDAVSSINAALYWRGALDGGIITALVLVVTYILSRRKQA